VTERGANQTDSGEVAPVRPGEDLDWGRLEAWLRANIPDLPEQAMAVLQFPRGTANLTYRLAFGPQQLVLRRPPFGKIAPGAHDMAREHAILSKLWQAWERAPRAYAFCEDAEVIGAPFVVSEYRGGGLVIFGEAPPSMAGLPGLGLRLATAMADALADLHRVDYAAVGLADLGKPDGFVERQVAGWRDRWRRVASGDCDARFEAMGARLADEMPQSGPPAIVHNDYKLDNCQFLPGDPDRVVSVFDWDMATLGDPLVDVGICLSYWPHMHRAQSLGLPDGRVFAQLYAERMGIDPDTLRWYEAFANWRTGVAVQQLYDRFAKGNSADARLGNVGKSVFTFLERAEAVIEGDTA
jgi:aminoglycoside phosphotransferase (APT) family kinase protein